MCGSSAAAGSSTRRVRCAAAGRSTTPDGQPVQDRISEVCSVPSESTAKPGTPRLSSATVRDSNASDVCRRVLGYDDLGVREIVDDCGDASPSRVRRDRPAPAARGRPAGRRPAPTPRRAAPSAGHPHPGGAGGVQLPLELVGIDRVGGGQNLGGEGVLVGTAERDPGVGQVGVDVERAVPRVAGAAAGGRDTGADQRHHQVARQWRGIRFARRDHLGHRHRP